MKPYINLEVAKDLADGRQFVGERSCGKTHTLIVWLGRWMIGLDLTGIGQQPIVLSPNSRDGHELQRLFRAAFPGVSEPCWLTLSQVDCLRGVSGPVFTHECELPDALRVMAIRLPFAGGVRSIGAYL